jgi:ribose 5-phosphate isomerase B
MTSVLPGRQLDEQTIRDMVRRVVYRAVGRPPPAAPARERILVTGHDLEGVPPGGEFEIPDGAIVTPLARQAAMERGITVVEAGAGGTVCNAERTPPAVARTEDKTVAIGADHGGFELKQFLKGQLRELGYTTIDCGTNSAESVDYPDFALAVGQLVAEGRAWRGVLVDGAGIGSCMAANKVPGVRAAMCYDRATAVNSRSHNDANVLTLGAGMIGPELARQIVGTWLETPTGGGRHARRVGKIMDIERRFQRKG